MPHAAMGLHALDPSASPPVPTRSVEAQGLRFTRLPDAVLQEIKNYRASQAHFAEGSATWIYFETRIALCLESTRIAAYGPSSSEASSAALPSRPDMQAKPQATPQDF